MISRTFKQKKTKYVQMVRRILTLRSVTLVTYILIVALLSSGCTDNTGKTDEETVEGVGTIVHVESDNGIYIIQLENGTCYAPVNLDEDYQVDGIAVYFMGVIPEDDSVPESPGIPIEIWYIGTYIPPGVNATIILEKLGAGSPTPSSVDNWCMEIPVNLSQIEIRSGSAFNPNIQSIIPILLNDPRTGLLLENGWNITSVSEKYSEEACDRNCIDVEFRNDGLGLSFYIVVDEQKGCTTEGYCDAEVWIPGPVSGPIPEDYHQAKDKTDGWWHVFDERNNRIIMIYNSTTFFYLYPSYSIIDMEGVLD
jgi:hypothetical protein